VSGFDAASGDYVTVITAGVFSWAASGSITAGAAMQYTTGRWLLTFDVAANDTYNNSLLLPGEGVLAQNGVYVYAANIAAVSIFYG
jgi:hypothetical protein